MTEKQAYKSPVLKTWGSVEDLTQRGPHAAGNDICYGSGSGQGGPCPSRGNPDD